jgi:GrpB-like predicted nucleotidyltransferase (UPF0157 family)
MIADAPIELVAADPSWPARFERERKLLDRALAPWLTGGIHHVGSTAVPGLTAKPVIDILAGVESLDASRPSVDALAALEYLYAPYRTDEMHWFCKPSPARRTHHLHLVATGSPRYRDELAFRDALRADPQLAGRYAELKRCLAARYRTDREAYTEGKAPFVAGVLARANA